MHACKLLLLLHPRSAFPSVLRHFISSHPIRAIPSHSKQQDRGARVPRYVAFAKRPFPSCGCPQTGGWAGRSGAGVKTTNPGYPRQRYTTHQRTCTQAGSTWGRKKQITEQRRDEDDDTTIRACHCRCRCPCHPASQPRISRVLQYLGWWVTVVQRAEQTETHAGARAGGTHRGYHGKPPVSRPRLLAGWLATCPVSCVLQYTHARAAEGG